jgi:four helix bundle protein
MKYFDHEKLDVYQASTELVVLIEEVVNQFPRGRSYLADQLQRAGTSIPLNIAEGAGEYSANEKSRFYRIAKRSATECASIFDICRRLRIVNEEKVATARELLIRIVSMLTKMSQSASLNRADLAGAAGAAESRKRFLNEPFSRGADEPSESARWTSEARLRVARLPIVNVCVPVPDSLLN